MSMAFSALKIEVSDQARFAWHTPTMQQFMGSLATAGHRLVLEV
jgi:hypothetical protein